MKTFFSKLVCIFSVLSLNSGYATVGVSDAQNLAIAVQSDGNIIAAGYVNLNNLQQFSTAQYNSSGIQNASYGNAGYFATPFGSGAEALGLALLSNNEAIVVGYGEESGGTSFAIGLFTTTGTLDTSFNGTGTNTTLIGNGGSAHGVAIDSSGNYVVAGVAIVSGNPQFALVRYTPSGALDSTFGTGGIVTTLIGNESVGYAVGIQSNGQIIVAGFASTSGGPAFAVARYNTNGSLDTTFNSSGSLPGTVTTTIGSFQATGYALAIQPNNQLVVGGVSNNAIALVRYNTDASLDTTFGSSGIVQTTVTGQNISQVEGLILQSNGYIVAVGYAGNDLLVARYTTVGALDTTFNSSGVQPGIVTAVIGNYAVGTSVALNSSSQIIVGGYSDQGALVACYNTNGTLNTNFGSSSGYTSFPNSSVGPDIFGLTSANLAPNAGVLYSQLTLTNGIVNSDINSSAAIQDSKLGTIQTAGKVLNSATTATSSNTTSAIVTRDSLGNFSANTITANLVGNVSGSASNNLLTAGGTMTGALVLPNGSAASPSLQFGGSTNSGLSLNSGNLTLSASGSAAVSIGANGAVTIATPSATGTGLTINGGGAVIGGNVAISGNLSFDTSSTALNNVGSTQGPALKLYTGTGNAGILGSVTVNYAAAGFVNPPQIYLTSINGLIVTLGVNSITNTSANILSSSLTGTPFNYLAVGV